MTQKTRFVYTPIYVLFDQITDVIANLYLHIKYYTVQILVLQKGGT